MKPKSIHYDKRTYTIKDQSISLATLEKRIVIPLIFSKHQRKLYDADVIREAELIHRKNQWFFSLALDLPNVSVTGNRKVNYLSLKEEACRCTPSIPMRSTHATLGINSGFPGSTAYP